MPRWGVYALFFAILVLSYGWIFAIGLRAWRADRRKERQERAMTTGMIVEARRKETWGGRRGVRRLVHYVPVVEFTAGGRVYRLENDAGSRHEEEIGIGRRVDLFYDAENPEHFHLADNGRAGRAPQEVMLLGAGLLVLAALLTAAAIHFRWF